VIYGLPARFWLISAPLRPLVSRPPAPQGRPLGLPAAGFESLNSRRLAPNLDPEATPPFCVKCQKGGVAPVFRPLLASFYEIRSLFELGIMSIQHNLSLRNKANLKCPQINQIEPQIELKSLKLNLKLDSFCLPFNWRPILQEKSRSNASLRVAIGDLRTVRTGRSTRTCTPATSPTIARCAAATRATRIRRRCANT